MVSGTATVGEICMIGDGRTDSVSGEVIAASDREARVMLFHDAVGLRPGQDVYFTGQRLSVPAGKQLLGRVLDGLGNPIDGGPPLGRPHINLDSADIPSPMERQRIVKPLVTGQRVIDGLLTLGKGQRVGLFAGSGVGKSTLMGEVVKHAQVNCNVIALIGERGREVLPFVQDALGELGRQRSVVIVATAEEPALMRIQAARTAVRIAESFRAEGEDVMFFLDSITRLAHAQREIGLSRGEPAGTRGYPPSVFRVMAQTLERLGTAGRGSITGLITVLVDGDDLAEPISDAARSILDGHIVLSRKLAERGIFPAVDVLGSVSRLFREITSTEQQRQVTFVRQIMDTYRQMEELIRMGLYQKGSSAEIDQALQLMPEVQSFCMQGIGESSTLDETLARLRRVAAQSERERRVS